MIEHAAGNGEGAGVCPFEQVHVSPAVSADVLGKCGGDLLPPLALAGAAALAGTVTGENQGAGVAGGVASLAGLVLANGTAASPAGEAVVNSRRERDFPSMASTASDTAPM